MKFNNSGVIKHGGYKDRCAENFNSLFIASLRGSQSGFNAAEAFELVYERIK